jgi:mono/diheme cytochrome c family protein
VGTSPGGTLEERSFKDFKVAFTGLLGRDSELNDAEMTSFARFSLQLTYPPNPNTALDNSLTTEQTAGKSVYNNKLSDGLATCNGCHKLDPAKGRFGTDGTMSFEGPRLTEDFKIPHLRNLYQKIGMFARNFPSSAATGDQIRGFGFENGGAQGTLSGFFDTLVFRAMSATDRNQIEQFLLVFPSNMNPVVGQQVTVSPGNADQADVLGRVNLLVQRALIKAPVPECKLVAKGVIGGQQRGWVMNDNQSFAPDRSADAALTLPGLLSLAKSGGAALTFTCVPPGNGTRIGVSRKGNGVLDRD